MPNANKGQHTNETLNSHVLIVPQWQTFHVWILCKVVKAADLQLALQIRIFLCLSHLFFIKDTTLAWSVSVQILRSWTYLILQSGLAGHTQAVIVRFVGGKVSFRHHMRPNKLTDLVAEPKMLQVLLAQHFMTAPANEDAIVGDHGRHFVCCRDKPADVMKQSSENGLIVTASIDCQLSSL
jgi:hypothetical protein